MKGSAYTIGYAAVLGTVCAVLLTGASALTEPRRKANAKAEETRHILDVLGVPVDEAASPEDMLEAFNDNVTLARQGGLDVYAYEKTGAVAVPFAGPGLWGPVKGFLSLESDRKTIHGVTFHEQEETPGLGGEISARWFRDRFRGKSIIGADGTPGMAIRRAGGGIPGANEVDAISGATMTCDKVQAMLNKTITILAKENDHDVR